MGKPPVFPWSICLVPLTLSLLAFTLTVILLFPEKSMGNDSPGIVIDFRGSIINSIPDPWKLSVVEGNAHAEILPDGGAPALYLRSVKSSFSLERQLFLNVREYPNLMWTWKALAIPPRGDLRKRSSNDQVLQILVAFDGSKVLSYVWNSNAPEGTVTDESIGFPLFITVKVMVVKTGISDRGKWLTITRNLYEDYKSIFKEEPKEVRGIRIQTNSQHTHDLSEAQVKRIVFSRAL